MLKDLGTNNIRDLDDALDYIKKLFNLVETLNQEILELKRQNQELRDENNRLKGEQGKPKVKSNKKKPKQYSSEKERKKAKRRKKRSKKDRIKTHNNQICHVDKSLLPRDAQFKGYDRVVVQDIKFEADNTLFLKEKYYSPSLNKSYLAPLPPGYEGEFGPGLKSLSLKLYFDTNVTQPRILDLLDDADIIISAGQLSNFLIKNHDGFHKEKDALYEAGLKSSPWHHIDDTSTRVNGQNQYCQILCNPLYTAYFTTQNKSRLTVIDVLRNFSARTFLLNSETFTYVDLFKLPTSIVQQLKAFPKDIQLGEEEFLSLLDERLPNLGPQQRSHVVDAAAVAAYHAQMEFPVIRLLICDDAPQFKLVTEELALCWIHDGRLYKKLDPCVPYHRQLLDSFLEQYWGFYKQLLTYQQHPTIDAYTLLDNEFDKLFSTVTGYYALDQRIAKTMDKKVSLLMVLDHPEIPLHNNPAELGARKRVRKRVVSFGTRTDDGTKAWDTFMSLSATAKKLGINFYSYLYDRISHSFKITNLADVIYQRAKEFDLAASWDTSP
ncbi:MAG: transposase [Deltaproteobacteria bacterium]|jgi:regulator of replication initiation timing|nr:transposase [Deltaproteobacteria bacterium]